MITLSPTMAECANRIRAHCGTITRYPGGFWCVENSAGETTYPTYGTTTIEALVARKIIEYCDWKESRRGRFPVKARIAQQGGRIQIESAKGAL